VAAVAVGVLYENWDKLSAAFSGTTRKLPEIKEGLVGIKDTLKEVDDQIEALEKQAKAGGLNLFDEEKLGKLRGIKLAGDRMQADEKLVSGVGPGDSPAAKAIAAAVKAALAETGGGDSAARTIAMNMGIGGDEATGIVAGAMRGNKSDLATLLAQDPTVAGAYKDPAQAARRKVVEARQKAEDASIMQAADDDERELEARRRRVEHRQRVEDAGIEQGADLEDQAAKDAGHAADRAARKRAHDEDPSNRLAAQLARQRDAVTREATGQWAAGGKRESIPQLQSIIGQAVNNLPDAGGDVAQAVRMAAQQAYRKAQMDMANALRRQQAMSNQRGGP
jgi:hypothetical protein